METHEERTRRKFNAGALEQLAATFGALAAGGLVASVLTPLVASVIGSAHMPGSTLVLIAVAGALGSAALTCGAVYLKGAAKQLDDDRATAASGIAD